MAYYYLKLYHEILDDPKMGQLPDHLWRRVIEIFLIASSQSDRDGLLPTIKEMAWKLRTDDQSMLSDLEEIEKTGIIQQTENGWLVRNFAKRQAAVSSTERAKQFKKREQVRDAICGIYKISCTETNKSYIGASIDIEKRVKTHFIEGKSFDTHWMHDDLITYGKDGFKVEILERVDDEGDLAERETYWIQHTPPELYNNESKGKNHRDWERNGNESLQNRSTELRVKDRVKDRVKAREEEDSAASLDNFDGVQAFIEQITGYPVSPTPDNVAAINEMVKMGAIEDDFRDALAYLSDRGKVARGATGLLGCVRTAVLKRTQSKNAKSSTKPYIPEEHASEVY